MIAGIIIRKKPRLLAGLFAFMQNILIDVTSEDANVTAQCEMITRERHLQRAFRVARDLRVA